MVRFLEYLAEAIFLIAAFAVLSFAASILVIAFETYLGIQIAGLREALFFLAGAVGIVFIIAVIFRYVYSIIVGEEE